MSNAMSVNTFIKFNGFSEWEYDYCIDSGFSAVCPNCGSSDIVHELFPTKCQSFLVCQDCGKESEKE